MWSTLIGYILQVILKMIPIFVNKKEEQEKIQKKINAEIEKYQKGVKDAAKVREEHQKLDSKLDDEWEKKFGTKPPPPPQKPVEVSEVKVNERFMFEIELPADQTVEVWAEKQYNFGMMIWNSVSKLYQRTLVFTVPGVRVLTVKVNGEWKISKTVTVRGE